MEDFYHVDSVSDRVIAIKSINGEFVYLILGDEKALLIDTCVGIKGLRKLVETLTDLPLTVALTHGHIDHAMGVEEFEDVYLNPLDIPIYQSQSDKGQRLDYLTAGLGKEIADKYEELLLEAKKDYTFKSLKDKKVFDLGNLHVEAHAFPGHTPGMMAFLIKEEKILILGDACNNSTFLFDENSSDVVSYLKAVENTYQELKGKFDKVYISHHEMEVQPDIMNNMINVCHDVIDGKADDLPFSFMGMTAFIAKECDDHFHRLDGKDGNLIYRKDKIIS